MGFSAEIHFCKQRCLLRAKRIVVGVVRTGREGHDVHLHHGVVGPIHGYIQTGAEAMLVVLGIHACRGSVDACRPVRD